MDFLAVLKVLLTLTESVTDFGATGLRIKSAFL